MGERGLADSGRVVTRLDRHLVAQACRYTGVALASVWIGSVALTVLGTFGVAGLPDAAALGLLAAWSLPVAIQCAVPLGAAWGAFVLVERRELESLFTAGLPPWRVSAALVAPLVVMVPMLYVAVHETRPAARAAWTDRAAAQIRTSPDEWIVDSGHGRRVGERAMALTTLGRRSVLGIVFDADGTSVQAGRFAFATDGAQSCGEFARADIVVAAGPPPLSMRVEQELSTAFLSDRGEVWATARASVESWDVRGFAARELRARSVAVWSCLLSTLLVTMPLWWSRARARGVQIGLAALAVAASAALPRWMS